MYVQVNIELLKAIWSLLIHFLEEFISFFELIMNIISFLSSVEAIRKLFSAFKKKPIILTKLSDTYH